MYAERKRANNTRKRIHIFTHSFFNQWFMLCAKRCVRTLYAYDSENHSTIHTNWTIQTTENFYIYSRLYRKNWKEWSEVLIRIIKFRFFVIFFEQKKIYSNFVRIIILNVNIECANRFLVFMKFLNIYRDVIWNAIQPSTQIETWFEPFFYSLYRSV